MASRYASARTVRAGSRRRFARTLRARVIGALLPLPLSFGECVHAADDSAMRAARDLAAGCAACHGTGGTGDRVGPALAGQRREDLLAILMAFKEGAKPGTVMPQLARGYTEAQLDELATWFASRPKPR